VQNQRVILRGLSGEVEGRLWESDLLLQVGRLTTSDVVIDDSSVSRQHAELAITSQGWAVRDLGSTNGTFLNGKRIGRAEQALHCGDILQFGHVSMIVDIVERQAMIAPSRDDTAMAVAGAVKCTWEDFPETLALLPGQGAMGRRPLLTLIQTGRDYYRFSSLDNYLQSILWEAAEALDARHGAILLRDDQTGRLVGRAVFALNGKRARGGWWDDRLARQAIDHGTSLLCHAAATDAPAADSPEALRSIIYAALRSPRGALGVLCLARPGNLEAFAEADLQLADVLALGVSPGIDSMAHLLDKQRELFLQTITALTQVVEMRGDAIYGQTERVTDYALLLAAELQLSDQDRHHLQLGVPLRDLGKIGIHEAIFQKVGPLTAAEREQMQTHVLKGTVLLETIPGMASLLPLVRSHHERWDGAGYPDRLAGEQIPMLARVVAVAEAFDAVSTDRPYRRKLGLPEAFAEIERHAGTQFDPDCVRALLRLRPKLEQLVRARMLTTSTLSRDAIREAVASLGLCKRLSDKRADGKAATPGFRA
jgi:HD-GYP domain-containing protein (c-di-GMP phosphodiesterase class II)